MSFQFARLTTRLRAASSMQTVRAAGIALPLKFFFARLKCLQLVPFVMSAKRRHHAEGVTCRAFFSETRRFLSGSDGLGRATCYSIISRQIQRLNPKSTSIPKNIDVK